MAIFKIAVYWLLEIMQWAIVARVLISWLPVTRDNPLVEILYQITEPILEPIRIIIERSPFGRDMMMFDFSPIVAFIIIKFIETMIF